MSTVRSWSDILGSSSGDTTGAAKRMNVNLQKVVEDVIMDHDKFQKVYESRGKFHVEYEDMKIVFDQKGWTIYHWELSNKKGPKGKFEKVRDGLSFRSDGVLETIKMLRAHADGESYIRPKPKATELDPAQKVFEMEQFRKDLNAKLQGHPLFVTAYISHVYIFVIYHDVLFSVRPDDYGNYEYELLERMGDLETKLCKSGKTVGRGGVIERIKELRSAWDLTHDLPPEIIEALKKERM
jgi:hypothetical protein